MSLISTAVGCGLYTPRVKVAPKGTRCFSPIYVQHHRTNPRERRLRVPKTGSHGKGAARDGVPQPAQLRQNPDPMERHPGTCAYQDRAYVGAQSSFFATHDSHEQRNEYHRDQRSGPCCNKAAITIVVSMCGEL